jgi:RimJ/RimL family protein N-acetyltransferase
MDTITIRKAIIEDSKDIYEWRNNEDTRFNSINTNEITWQDHCKWYLNVLSSLNVFMVIGILNDGTKIGVVRFNLHPNVAFVSINLNPSFRGKKLSSLLLLLSIKKFLTENNLIIRAKIKRSNISSIKCFTRCGFKFYFSKDEVNEYYLERI